MLSFHDFLLFVTFLLFSLFHTRKLEIIRFFYIAKFPHTLLVNFVSRHMAGTSPIVLILGHLFIHGLCHDLETGFDQQADVNFNLLGTAVIFMHGMGGQTVPKLCMFDRLVVKQLSKDIIILERETNDLTRIDPGVVGSEIDDFVCFHLDNLTVCVVCVCHVIPHVFSCGKTLTRVGFEPTTFGLDH